MTTTALPGEWVDHAPGLDDLGGTYQTRISTDRYRSREYAEREREAIWMNGYYAGMFGGYDMNAIRVRIEQLASSR